MKNLCTAVVLVFFIFRSYAQDPWLLKTDTVNPSNYYGETVANGMVGIVSSPEPLRLKMLFLPARTTCMEEEG